MNISLLKDIVRSGFFVILFFKFSSGDWNSCQLQLFMGFPGGSDGKESTCSSGDLCSIPGSGRSPGEGNGNPLQYSCLENSMVSGAWWATIHGVAKNDGDMTDDFYSQLFYSYSVFFSLILLTS